LPTSGIVDISSLDVELVGEGIYQFLGSAYLVIRSGGFSFANDANANGFAAAIPGCAGQGGPLIEPFFSGLNLAVECAETVADEEMEIKVFGT
jgi:hypothetical protein